MRRRIKSFLLVLIMLFSYVQTAQAQFGGIVFDPKNFVQNLYTASRSLIQIRQQVSQLRNEARMLIGQAKDLAKMDYNAQYELLRILQEIATLTEEAENVSMKLGAAATLCASIIRKNMLICQMMKCSPTQKSNGRIPALLLKKLSSCNPK